MITGAAVVAGVVGAPVSQSLSPVLHNAWIAARGLDAAYAPFAVRPEGFERWIGGLRAGGGVRGLNVTMPFKARAAAVADRVTDAARLSGGANLLLFEPTGDLLADSTDGRGLLAAFAEQAPGWRADAAPVVVFGAGGAAGAAVAALVGAGAPQVRVVVRDLARARHIASAFGALIELFGFDAQARALADAGGVVNATPLGFRGGPELELAWGAVPPAAVVMDMVTAPLETPLLAAARSRGHRAVDGLAMLIGQARPSFAAMFGVEPPPETDVRALALQAIAERGG